MASEAKTGWEVRTAAVSQRNGGLYVTGVNHETTDPLMRTFYWHIHRESLRDSRFNFDLCTFEPGARACLERLTK